MGAYKGIKKYEQHEENPFVDEAVQEVKIQKKMQVVRPTRQDEIVRYMNDKGDLDVHSQFIRIVEVDEDKFVKVYLSQFIAFWELNRPAIKVFTYIANIAEVNKDVVLFQMDKCKEYTKYVNDKDIITGLAGLIECKIIARTNYEYLFFINPLIFFNGSRVTFAKTYVKKQVEKKRKDNEQQVKIFPEDALKNFELELVK